MIEADDWNTTLIPPWNWTKMWKASAPNSERLGALGAGGPFAPARRSSTRRVQFLGSIKKHAHSWTLLPLLTQTSERIAYELPRLDKRPGDRLPYVSSGLADGLGQVVKDSHHAV